MVKEFTKQGEQRTGRAVKDAIDERLKELAKIMIMESVEIGVVLSRVLAKGFDAKTIAEKLDKVFFTEEAK